MEVSADPVSSYSELGVQDLSRPIKVCLWRQAPWTWAEPIIADRCQEDSGYDQK